MLYTFLVTNHTHGSQYSFTVCAESLEAAIHSMDDSSAEANETYELICIGNTFICPNLLN